MRQKNLSGKSVEVNTCRMPRTYFTASSAENTLNKPSQARIINLKQEEGKQVVIFGYNYIRVFNYCVNRN